MKDRSNKLIFMAVTAAMYSAVLYGSEASLAVIIPGGPWRTAEMFPLTPVLAAFGAERRSADAKEQPVNGAGTSVVPNSASCPAAAALAAPPSVNAAIGKDEPALTRDASPRPQSNAALGTGASCPPLHADAGPTRLGPLPGTAPAIASRTDRAGSGGPDH